MVQSVRCQSLLKPWLQPPLPRLHLPNSLANPSATCTNLASAYPELRLMTTFLAGIPSASWRLQAAGQTSPAWVRAPSSGAEEEMRICGCMASRSWSGGGEEATALHQDSNSSQHLIRPPVSLQPSCPPLLIFPPLLPQKPVPRGQS